MISLGAHTLLLIFPGIMLLGFGLDTIREEDTMSKAIGLFTLAVLAFFILIALGIIPYGV